MVKLCTRSKSFFSFGNQNSQNYQFKKGEAMTINELATVRTGLVTARKKPEAGQTVYRYRLLNLKCIAEEGYIQTHAIEPYEASMELKPDYFTRMGDVLVRLSAPYTAVFINREELCGLLVPSHFAIVRARQGMAEPEYLYWLLRRNKNRIKMMQNSSGSTAFGTISTGLISALSVTPLPLAKQRALGKLLILTEREQELLHCLAAEKKKYGALLMDEIYNKMKRGF